MKTDMRVIALLLAFLPSLALAGNVNLVWSPVTAYDDSTPIASGTQVTYNLYGAQCTACPCTGLTLIQSAIVASAIQRTGVLPGFHGYTVTAVVAGVESGQSNQSCVNVQASTMPATPSNLVATPLP